jgi:peptidoglycan/xylan/chitin deacetylase (PgdA/CDA1 family)
VVVDKVRVPILMYHHLESLIESQGPDYDSLFVSPKKFLEQVMYLQRMGYETITFAQLVGAFEGETTLPEKPVIITFDDGWDDIYTVAYPILREHGMVATFFISTNWIENLEGTVTWEQIQELSEAGMELGSHSFTHPYLTQSDPDWLKIELEESKAALERRSDRQVVAIAYPFGLYDDNVIAAVRSAGYRVAATIDRGVWAYRDQPWTLPRVWVYDWMDLEDFAALLELP